MDRLSGDDGTGDIPRAPLPKKEQDKMQGKGGRTKKSPWIAYNATELKVPHLNSVDIFFTSY